MLGFVREVKTKRYKTNKQVFFRKKKEGGASAIE
jgi:hypothetical protein